MPKPVEVVTQYYAVPLNYFRAFHKAEYVLMYIETSLVHSANFVSFSSYEATRKYFIQIQPHQQPVHNEY